MELENNVELIDCLLVDATNHIKILEQTVLKEQREGTEGVSDVPGTQFHPDPYTIREELALWKKTHDGLIMARSALEQIEKAQYERARNAKNS